jgi:dTDP-4-dehydrorhamnose reductase
MNKSHTPNILLTGASGKLGSAIKKSKLFKNLLTPELNTFDIIKTTSIETFFAQNSFNTIIHCAAQARIAIAEKDPIQTIQANIIGTANLVSAILKKEKEQNKNIRFIHISTDGVYKCDSGNYSEKSATIPYNKYGWTKLGAECSVNLLSNYCIIRTAFFNPQNIPFEDSAVDGFSSKLKLAEFVKALKFITESNFKGTINIGSEKKSDYKRYKEFKTSLKPCTYEDIQKSLPFKIYQDASMNITKWKKLKESNENPQIRSQSKIINHRSCL